MQSTVLWPRSGHVEFDRGGHFPAMEVPDLLVGDLRTCFRPLCTKESS